MTEHRIDLSNIVLPYDVGAKLATDVLETYFELRDEYGQSEADARVQAISEFAEGMAVDVEAEVASIQAEQESNYQRDIGRLGR